jgi:rod shape-determining protein MreD
VRRLTFALVAILAAVVVQTALLDRLPFPGGSAPNLVLVLVVTLALASGPTEGMLIGFGAGLALDIAPPASNLLGLSALVFCVIGYGCGRLRGPLERSSWLPLAVVALGVAAGETLYALAGMTFGDPDITWQSVRLVLPVSVIYDILLCPFVLYAVVRFGGYGGWAMAGRRQLESLAGREPAGAGLLGGVAAAGGGAVRDTRSGREPRLRPAAGRGSDGWIGGHLSGPGQQPGSWVSRRPPQLRARGGVAGSAAAAQAGLGARPGPGQARPVRLRLGSPRRADGVLGGSLRAMLGVGLAGPSGPGASPRLSARAFRGSGGPAATAGGGVSRGLLGSGSPLARPRRRSRAFRGGPSALTAAGRGKAGRTTSLRLRRRRGDGVLGGGVLGGRSAGSMGAAGGGREMPGAAFGARRTPGAPGALRHGRGPGAVPKFRSSGRGLRRWGDRLRPGRRGSRPGGAFAGGPFPGERRGFGRRRGFGAGRRSGFRWRAPWRKGTKRTGGLP